MGHGLDAGDAEPHRLIGEGIQRVDAHRRIGRELDQLAEDRILRVLEDAAVDLAVGSALEASAAGIRRVVGNSECLQTRGADDRAVAGEGVQEHLSIGRDLVESRARDARVVDDRRADGSDEPLVGGDFVESEADARRDVGERRLRRRAEVEAERFRSGMGVGVVDARNDDLAVKPESLRVRAAGNRADFLVRTDGLNRRSLDGHRFRERFRGIVGEDLGVEKNDRRLRAERERDENRGEREDHRAFHKALRIDCVTSVYSLFSAAAMSMRAARRAGASPASADERNVTARETAINAAGVWQSIVQPKDCLLMT